jgi:hypothetical protein
MAQMCRQCSRANPAEASFCYYDGYFLDGHGVNQGPLKSGTQLFHNPFVFPSGRTCQNFDQLALAFEERWTEAVTLLQQGYLENFLSGLGRTDLALAAHAAAQFPDADRGMDQLLDALPSQALEPPRLQVTPREINLGQLQVGQNDYVELHLVNQGMRLLHGSVSCEDCLWLSLGDSLGQQRKLFETRDELTIPVRVRGTQLRAGHKPLVGRLVIESNGGDATVPVRAELPVTPFPEGVLAGATTPREVALKAKKAPKEAGALFEKGAVAAWYQQNGWTYPVQGPPASGWGGVQQFFEALALTKPPKVTISESSVYCLGTAGERFEHALVVKTDEKRPVFAYATSNRWWLEVGNPHLAGRTATIPLIVPCVPNCPGGVLFAQVLVTANGHQRFTVDVTLAIGGSPGSIPTVVEAIEDVIPVTEVIADVLPVVPVAIAGKPRRSR